ncbi:MAG: glycosyltransferase [Lachnospiraceae bacterium]|nr:glycosyltransferase [Lachnospiraceae bacterium]
MKLLTFAIPSYNSESFMDKCIESLLPGGEDVEILIINDGSTDMTGHVADEYEQKYPNIVRAIHQENKGHGGAVNTGIQQATGKYFKVVDSDDWVDDAAYRKVLSTLKRLESDHEEIDMLLTNYVYEKEGKRRKRHMMYTPLFPRDRVIGWENMKRNIKGFSILMHSVIYRTEMLRKSGLTLPEHTFYVDNLFVYIPLPYVKKFYYLNVDFYRYYIGREGQSVAEKTMVRRIDQQLRVNYMMIDLVDPWAIEEKHLREYMLSYLEMITVVSTSIGYVSKDKENLRKVKELWRYIRNKDRRTYRHLRYGVLGGTMQLPGRFGRFISVRAYKLAQRVMGFN